VGPHIRITTVPSPFETYFRYKTQFEDHFEYRFHQDLHAGEANMTVMLMWEGKGKGLPQQAEVALGVPGRLRPRIFLTFGTTRVVGHQPYAPAAFATGEIPGTHF
jgi:hypothetical protein